MVIPTGSLLPEYLMSSHVVLTFRCSSDVSKLMCPPAPPTSMLKTSGSTKSTTRPEKGGVGVGGDGGDNGGHDNKYTSRLMTSTLMNSSTSAAQVSVKYDEVGGRGGSGGKLVKKSSKVEESSKSPKVSKV